MAEVYLKGKIDRSNEKRYDFCKLQSKNEYHIFFLSVSSVTHELAIGRAKQKFKRSNGVSAFCTSLFDS